MSTPTSIVVVTLRTSRGTVRRFSIGVGSRTSLNTRARRRCSLSGLVWPVSFCSGHSTGSLSSQPAVVVGLGFGPPGPLDQPGTEAAVVGADSSRGVAVGEAAHIADELLRRARHQNQRHRQRLQIEEPVLEDPSAGKLAEHPFSQFGIVQ